MKTDDVNQMIVNTFEKPILEVEEAFKALVLCLCVDLGGRHQERLVQLGIDKVQEKINALKELVPTVQDDKRGE